MNTGVKFYIASSLENYAQVREVAEQLKQAGHIHTYDWTVHGSVGKEGPKRLCEVAQMEKQGVLDADIVIVILPGHRGTHAELGMAIAAGKPVLICAEKESLIAQDTCAFYWSSCCLQCIGTQQRWIANAILLARCVTGQKGESH